jgi:hypothetical protein
MGWGWMAGIPWVWGATPDEVAADYACDRFVTGPKVACFRAAESTATTAAQYRWLCQLRVAPYSYDLLDNFGRQSPRTLTPGVEKLELGQVMMTIFRLVDFTPGHQITLRLDDPRAVKLFGHLAVTYTVLPTADGSRLVVKLTMAAEGGRLHAVRRRLLVWGDLLMMRKQLLQLTSLATQPGLRPKNLAL